MKLKEIKPNPNNPRVLRDDKFQKLKQSIKEFPKMLSLRPMVIDENNVVLGGNMRLRALQELGFTDIDEAWVKRSSDLTEEEKKRFIIADNVAFGEWDWDTLANDWEVVDLEAWGLDIPQFDTVEELEASEDDYEVPEGGIETDIVIGDLFEIGEHRLLCGDSTDSDAVARLMNGEKADMVYTDPPYGMHLDVSNSNNLGGKDGWKNKAKNYTAVIGDGDDFKEELINTIFACFNDVKEIFIWGADYFAELLPNKNDGSWLVWDKRFGVEEMKLTFSEFELCWSKEKHLREMVRITWSGILGTEQEFDHKRHHPTQKPTKLSRWFIEKFSSENNLIADIYLGSGSTMLSCHQTKRRCYGMELEPKYCQVIIDRMRKLDSSLIIKRNGMEYKTTK
jgi:DNA modification methylase